MRKLTVFFATLLLLFATSCDTVDSNEPSDESELSLNTQAGDTSHYEISQNNAGNEYANMKPNSLFLGKNYTEIESERTANSRMYQLENGSYVLQTRVKAPLSVGKASTLATKTEGAPQTKANDTFESDLNVTVKFREFRNTGTITSYASEISNLGYYNNYFSDFTWTITNETFRISARFGNISQIQNNSTIKKVGFNFSKFPPTGGVSSPSERRGDVEVLKFSSANSAPRGGTQEHYDAVGAGEQYMAVTSSGGAYFESDRVSSSSLITNVRSAVNGSGDHFAVGLKAAVEGSTGVLFRLNFIDMYVEWTPPASAPTTPVLISPSNGVQTSNTSINFRWSSSGSPSPTFQLQVDDNSNFSSPVFARSGIISSSQTVSRLSRKKYYWRVRASNSAGTSAWSSVRNFTIINAPLSVVISGPQTGCLIPQTWEAEASGGSGTYSYRWEGAGSNSRSRPSEGSFQPLATGPIYNGTPALDSWYTHFKVTATSGSKEGVGYYVYENLEAQGHPICN